MRLISLDGMQHIVGLMVVWLGLSFFQVGAYAQEKFSRKAEKLRIEGDHHADFGKYAEAEKFYLKAIENSKNYRTAYQRLAHVYIQMKNYQKAYEALNRVIKIGGDFPSEVYFRMAQVCFALGRLKECEDFIFQYSAVPKMSPSRQQELQQLKDNLEFARQAMQKPVPFHPVSVGEHINTENDEYFPTLTADEEKLFFTRLVRKGNFAQEDILFSQRQPDGTWGKPVSVGTHINKPTNEGAHSISADGRELYLTLCEHQGGYGGCDIYVAKRIGDQWGTPQNLGPVINTPNKETQPCISADGTTLYFVSSRPGGLGKLDIWMSRRKPDGTWDTPVNLGPQINSAGIDERPYIHPDNNTLYFSSDGRKGFGNADIYFARRHELTGAWNEAENIGYPINSYYYEGGLFVTVDGAKGYFATERMNDRFQMDIFQFDMPEYARPGKVTFVKGTITSAATKKPLAAHLVFYDLQTGKIVNEKTADAVTGEYLLTLPLGKQYVVHASAPHHLFHSHHFSLQNKPEATPFVQHIELQQIDSGNRLVLENVFFETDSFTLKPQSYIELDRVADFLHRNPQVMIEISGHTDNMGRPEYNRQLSEKRAKSVYDYLLMKNVSAYRLSYAGYGDSRPIADNDTEEGRRKNRRTELCITGRIE